MRRLLLAALIATSSAATSTPPPDYVLVPGGYMHTSCVRPAPPSASPPSTPCGHPFLRRSNATHGSAWKAWAQVSAPSGSVSSINSTWVVPGPPISPTDQTLFFWNGVEPEDTSAVLQPVLQWGTSAAGGGPYWAYASWYVSASHGSHYSPLVQVATGESVVGSNALESDGVTWVISAAAPGKKASTVRDGAGPAVCKAARLCCCARAARRLPFFPPTHPLPAPSRRRAQLTFKPVAGAWPTAYHVLEAYGVTTECDLYPAAGAVNFTVNALAFGGNAAPSPIAWEFESTQAAGCGERASATAGGKQVSISFNTN
jgi:hypothetical protein